MLSCFERDDEPLVALRHARARGEKKLPLPLPLGTALPLPRGTAPPLPLGTALPLLVLVAVLGRAACSCSRSRAAAN